MKRLPLSLNSAWEGAERVLYEVGRVMVWIACSGFQAAWGWIGVMPMRVQAAVARYYPPRRARQISSATGTHDTAIIPTTSMPKLFFTSGMLPNA